MFFQKKVLKKIPSDISAEFGVKGRIFNINLNYSIVIVGGWRLEFSNAQLPYCGIELLSFDVWHVCFEGFLEPNGLMALQGKKPGGILLQFLE